MKIKMFNDISISEIPNWYNVDSITHKNNIYLYAMSTSSSYGNRTKLFYKYDIEKNEFVKLADLPMIPQHSTCCAKDDNLFVFCTYIKEYNACVNATLKYSISKNKWQVLNPYPYTSGNTTSDAASAIVGDYAYFLLPLTSDNSFYRYNLLDDSWEKLQYDSKNTTGTRRKMYVYNKKLYLIGDYNLASKNVCIYDIETNTWNLQELKNYPGAGIGNGCGKVIGNKLYCFTSIEKSVPFGDMCLTKIDLDTLTCESCTGVLISSGLNNMMSYGDNNNFWGVINTTSGEKTIRAYCLNIKNYHKNIETEITTDLTSQITGINSIDNIDIDSLEEPNTKIRHAFSFDGKITWKVYKENEWKVIDKNDILSNGMNKDEIKSLTSDDFLKLNLPNDSTLNVCSKMISYDDMFSPILRKITCKL